MSESRVVHLDVRAHLDGKNEVGVTLTETPRGNIVIEARPKGKRLVYKALASEAVKWLVARDAKPLPAVTEGGRTVHLYITEDVDVDGQNEASITLTEAGRDFIIGVRGKHQRTVHEGLMSDVALFVAARHSKYLAQQNGIAVPKPRRGTGRL